MSVIKMREYDGATRFCIASTKKGSVCLLPSDTKRDHTLLNCVRHALYEREDGPKSWVLVTTDEREKHWEGVLNVHSFDKTDKTDKTTNKKKETGIQKILPRCIMIVTSSRLGLLQWFFNSDKTSENVNKKEGGVAPQSETILAVDEAHHLLPYLHTQPQTPYVLQGFAKVLHFTYDIRLRDLGYLLRTLPYDKPDDNPGVKTGNGNDNDIHNFPVEDDVDVFESSPFTKQSTKHMLKMMSGKMVDYAMISTMLALVILGGDRLGLTGTNTKRSYTGNNGTLKGRANWTKEDEAHDRLVKWQAHTQKPAATHKKSWWKWRGGRRTHRNRPPVKCATRRRTRRRTPTRRRGGMQMLVPAAGYVMAGAATVLPVIAGSFFASSVGSLTLFGLLNYLQPGTARSIGETFGKAICDTVDGIFTTVSSTSRAQLKGAYGYVDKAMLGVFQFNAYLLKQAPSSVPHLHSAAKWFFHAFQYLINHVLRVPRQYQMVVVAYVALYGILYGVQQLLRSEFNKENTYNEKQMNDWKLHDYVYVYVDKDRTESTKSPDEWCNWFHSKYGPRIRGTRVEYVTHCLSKKQTSEAVKWSVRCHNNPTESQLRNGLRIAVAYNENDDKRYQLLHEHIKTLYAKDSIGVVFTHFTDTVDTVTKYLESKQIHIISSDKQTDKHNWGIFIVCAEDFPKEVPKFLRNITHVHFFEPCSYSYKDAVCTLLQINNSDTTESAAYHEITDHTKIASGMMIAVLAGAGVIGTFATGALASRLPLFYTLSSKSIHLYEYRSRYPKLLTDSFGATSLYANTRHSLTKTTPTPDDIVISKNMSAHKDIRRLAKCLKEKHDTILKDSHLRDSQTDTSKQKYTSFSESISGDNLRLQLQAELDKARLHYEKKLKGHADDWTEDAEAKFQRLLMAAEKAKNDQMFDMLADRFKGLSQLTERC